MHWPNCVVYGISFLKIIELGTMRKTNHFYNLSRFLGTIPAKLLLQLTTAFREGGLRDRTCTFSYKDQLHKCNIPVLALAGDQDLICPPEAVYGKQFSLLLSTQLISALQITICFPLISKWQIPLSSFLSSWLHTKLLGNQMVHIMVIMIWSEADWWVFSMTVDTRQL